MRATVNGVEKLYAVNSDHQTGPLVLRGWGNVYIDNVKETTAP